jgi:copper transport protein
LIILTGVLLSALRLGSFFNLLSTDYGLVLTAKVSLVLALLALAGYNRFRLTPRFVSAPNDTSRAFTGSICVELLIVGAILGVLGLWRFIPPPIGAAQLEQPTVAYIKGAEVTAFITIAPLSGYARSLTIDLIGRDSKPLKAEQVWMTVSYTTIASAPVRRQASQIGDGKYWVDGVVTPNPGLWKFQIDILSGSKHAQLEQELLLGGRPIARLVDDKTNGMQPMPDMQGM